MSTAATCARTIADAWRTGRGWRRQSPIGSDVMLHDFIEANRGVIISRTRDRVGSRPWPSVATGELEHGVPLFLTQLSETLRLEATPWLDRQ